MNTKKIITFTFLSVVIVLIAGFSACDRVSQIVQPTTHQMAEPSEEISIGVVLPLTGRLADSSGRPVQQGFELALDEINDAQPDGTKFKFIVKDDQSTVEGAVEAFNTLIQEGVSIILGPVTSTQTEIVFPIAQENQIVAISPTSAARDLSAIGDYVFRVALTTDVLTPSGIEATQPKLGYQKAATIYDETDLFSTDGDAAVREVLTTKGIEVVATETFQGGDTDFSEQLTKIKALNPDVIFVSSLPPEKPGMLKQAHQLGITATFVVRTLTAADVQAAGAAAAEGAMTFVGWGSVVDTPGNQAFIESYNTKFGVKPHNFSARAYATLHILAEAVANAQSTDPASIRDALANIKDLDTIFGPFSFNTDGDAIYDAKVLIVKDGELVRFE